MMCVCVCVCTCKKLNKPPLPTLQATFENINLSAVSSIKAEKAFSQTLELIFP